MPQEGQTMLQGVLSLIHKMDLSHLSEGTRKRNKAQVTRRQPERHTKKRTKRPPTSNNKGWFGGLSS